MKSVKTLAIYSALISMGMGYGVIGPTLLDLKTQVLSDLNQVSFILPARSGGYALGSIIMGFLFDKVNFQLYSSVVMAAAAVFYFLVAHVNFIYGLIGLFFFIGFVLGSMDNAGNVFLLYMWGRECEPFIQAFHFAFGVGALISPFFTEPFLFEVAEEGMILDENEFNVTKSMAEPQPENIQLIYPYSFVGVAFVFCFVFFFFLWMFYPQTEEHPSRKIRTQDIMNNNIELVDCDLEKKLESKMEEKRLRRYKIFKVMAIGFSDMFMFSLFGLELTCGAYIMAFVVESDLKLSKCEGSQLTSLFWSTFTFWRLCTIFYIQYIGSELNIALSITVMFLGSVILTLFSHVMIGLWLGIGLLGLGVSSVWGSMFGYINDHFSVTSRIASSMTVAASTGVFIFPVVISSFLETDPKVFLWILLFCSVTCILLFICVVLIMRLEIRKFNQQNEEKEKQCSH